MSQRFSRLAGSGSALPGEAVTNRQLVERLALRGVETSNDWIVSRTGIRQRYFVGPGDNTTSLAAQAAKVALLAADFTVESIDLIVVATSTPDQTFPSTACAVQAILGATGAAAFDLQAVCSGFVYGLSVADAMLQGGQAQRALVIGAEVFSRIMDWEERGTCVLFGDGAGAVALEVAEQPGIIASKLRADGRLASILSAGGRVDGGRVVGDPFLRMDGQAVFKQAVQVLDHSAREVMARAELPLDAIDWLIPHQANVRILAATARRLGLPDDRVVVTVDQHGNTSAASVPLALDVALRDGRIRRGQHLLLQGVGGGFTWGSLLLRY